MLKKSTLTLAVVFMLGYTLATPVLASQYTYYYDGNNRLVEIQKYGATFEKLTYDLNGNLTLVQIAPVVTDSSTTSSSATLTWGAIPHATKYTIYNGSTKVGESDTNSFEVSGLTSSKDYNFQVTAVYDNGNESLPGSVKLLSAPSANTVTSKMTGSTYIQLSWGDVLGASSYKVFGGESSTPVVTTSTSVIISNLTPGKTYTFTICTNNGVADGLQSDSKTFSTLLTDPVVNPPTNPITPGDPPANS